MVRPCLRVTAVVAAVAVALSVPGVPASAQAAAGARAATPQATNAVGSSTLLAERSALSRTDTIAAEPTAHGFPADERMADTTTIEPVEEGYFELFVERLPERASLVTLVDEDGRVLLPLLAVLAHVGIPAEAAGDTLILEWPPDVWRTVALLDGRTIVTEVGPRTYKADEWVARDGELYLSESALADVLRARVEVRFADLLVVVSGNPEFPAIRKLAQEVRRARGRFSQPLRSPDPYGHVPYPDRTGGIAGGWGLSVAGAAGNAHATYRAAVGGSVLGGATEASVSGLVAEGPTSRPADLFLRHTRVFLGTNWVRRLDVGSVVTEGTVARHVTGFTLTNGPLSTPRYFGEAVIAPAVPAGWEYEVYQGEYLVGVSNADAPTSIQAPIGYGSTPVRVRLIGPAGQEVEQDLVYVVPAVQVQSGTWRYSIGGGVCRDDVCDGYYVGQLSRGIDSRLTLGLGGDFIHGDSTSSLRPFALASFAPRPDVSLELQVRPSSYLRTGAQWVGGHRGTASASYTWAGGGTPELGAPGWAGQVNVAGRVAGLGDRWLTGRLLVRGRQRSRVEAWQAAVSTTLRRTHLGIEIESGLQPGTLTSVRALHVLGGLRPSFLDDAAVSAALGAGSAGVELLELGVQVRTRTSTRLDARLRLREGVEPTFTLGASLRSGLGFFQARGTRGAPGVSGFLGADGGFAYGRGEGFRPETTTSVGWAGISGVAFEDADGDGARGPDEALIADAVVMVSGRRVRTDVDGRYQVWGMLPYEGVSISVDPLSLDLGWAFVATDMSVRPSPNMFTRVDLPVIPTREVLGSVVDGDDTARGLGGVRVDILDDGGDVVADVRTFSDGVFYFESVTPGRYRLRVLGVGGRLTPEAYDKAREFIVPSTPGPAIELPPVKLVRRVP